jgi:hypothetical protein
MHSFFSCSLKFWISITKKALRLKKKSVSPVLGRRMGVLYFAMYGQTVTSFGKTVRL